MTSAMVLAAGGALGAFVRMLATRNVATWGRETLAQCFVGFLSMGLLGAAPQLVSLVLDVTLPGADQFGALTAHWFTAGLLGSLGGYVGLDLARLIRQRLPARAIGNGGNGTTPPKALLVLLLPAVLLLGGCASTVSFPAGQFGYAAGKLAGLWTAHLFSAMKACQTKKQLAHPDCQVVAALAAASAEADTEIKRALAEDRRVDLDKVLAIGEKALPILLRIAEMAAL